MSFLNKVYISILKTHDNLSDEDLEYAIPLLINIYKDDPKALVHLDQSGYIGILSQKYNTDVDNLIVSRNLKSLGEFWPEIDRLSQSDKDYFSFLENIAVVAMINYLHIISIDGSAKSLSYGQILDSLCATKNIEYPKTIVTMDQCELGSRLKIKKCVYTHLKTLLDNLASNQETDVNLREKYKRELMLYSTKV